MWDEEDLALGDEQFDQKRDAGLQEKAACAEAATIKADGTKVSDDR